MNSNVLPLDSDLMILFDKNHVRLVTVKPDGTVIIHQHGANIEAAEVFWNSLQFYGKSLLTRLAEVEEENTRLRTLLNSLHSSSN